MSARRFHSTSSAASWPIIRWTPWNEHLFGFEVEQQSMRPRHRVQGRMYRLMKRRAGASIRWWGHQWHQERSRRRFDLSGPNRDRPSSRVGR